MEPKLFNHYQYLQDFTERVEDREIPGYQTVDEIFKDMAKSLNQETDINVNLNTVFNRLNNQL